MFPAKPTDQVLASCGAGVPAFRALKARWRQGACSRSLIPGKRRTPQTRLHSFLAALGGSLHFSGPQRPRLESGNNSTHFGGARRGGGAWSRKCDNTWESICSSPEETEDGEQVPFYGIPKRNTRLETCLVEITGPFLRPLKVYRAFSWAPRLRAPERARREGTEAGLWVGDQTSTDREERETSGRGTGGLRV